MEWKSHFCGYDGRLHKISEPSNGRINVFRINDVFLFIESHMRIASLPFQGIEGCVRNIAHHSNATIVSRVELSQVLQTTSSKYNTF